MTGYVKDVILSDEGLAQAREYVATQEWNDVWQYYNLFHLQRLDIPPDHFELDFLKELHTYSRLSHNIGCYFLRYPPNSFTRMHQDNESQMTIVTMIDSKDLVGGDCVIEGEYQPPGPRPDNQICHRHKDQNVAPPYGQTIVPDIVKLENGQSMVYGPDLKHGVSKVYEGERIVLITWFKNGARKDSRHWM